MGNNRPLPLQELHDAEKIGEAKERARMLALIDKVHGNLSHEPLAQVVLENLRKQVEESE